MVTAVVVSWLLIRIRRVADAIRITAGDSSNALAALDNRVGLLITVAIAPPSPKTEDTYRQGAA
jgi:hypothetical protein